VTAPRWLQTSKVVLPDGGGGLRVVPARIGLEAGRITAVLERPGPAPDGVIDLGDRLLGPAFVDAHTHLSMTGFRGITDAGHLQGNVVEDLFFRIERNLLPEDVVAFTRLGAWDAALSGVGTVWDHYYYGESVAEGLADVGLCGVVAPTAQDLDGPGRDGADEALRATEALLAPRWASRGIVPAVGPHATDTVSDALFERLGALAEAHGLPWHMHVSQSLEEVERSWQRHGCSPIERLDHLGVLDRGAATLLVHAVFASDADLARLRPGRNPLGYCPWSQVQFAFPAPIEAWVKTGNAVLLGTDCAACNDTNSVQGDLRALVGGGAFAVTAGPGATFRADGSVDGARALQAARNRSLRDRERWSEPARALATVWSDPGRLHPGLPVGAVEVGAIANLCVWDLDHPALWPGVAPLRSLVWCDATPALYGVLLQGCWLGEPGDLQGSVRRSPEWLEARREADARLARLLQRAGLR
jgi:cytosine/adenosine deaminase-related metal-dependent hydrolase